jgi:O-antigen/teichoic acid export membrane protein
MALVKSSFIYLGTELINKAIPFLLLPLLTKYLTPTEYGIYGMYQVIISFLAPFISMSLDINITKNFFKVNKEEMSKILSSIFLILHINIIISLIIIYIISLFYSNFLGIPSNILLIMPLLFLHK